MVKTIHYLNFYFRFDGFHTGVLWHCAYNCSSVQTYGIATHGIDITRNKDGHLFHFCPLQTKKLLAVAKQ